MKHTYSQANKAILEELVYRSNPPAKRKAKEIPIHYWIKWPNKRQGIKELRLIRYRPRKADEHWFAIVMKHRDDGLVVYSDRKLEARYGGEFRGERGLRQSLQQVQGLSGGHTFIGRPDRAMLEEAGLL